MYLTGRWKGWEKSEEAKGAGGWEQPSELDREYLVVMGSRAKRAGSERQLGEIWWREVKCRWDFDPRASGPISSESFAIIHEHRLLWRYNFRSVESQLKDRRNATIQTYLDLFTEKRPKNKRQTHFSCDLTGHCVNSRHRIQKHHFIPPPLVYATRHAEIQMPFNYQRARNTRRVSVLSRNVCSKRLSYSSRSVSNLAQLISPIEFPRKLKKWKRKLHTIV